MMTAKEAEDKLMLFAYKLGDYQKHCINGGFYAGQGRLTEGRAEADKVNALQEEMISWLRDIFTSK